MSNMFAQPGGFNNGYLPKNSRVVQLLIQKMPGYQNQYLRPFQANANQGLMDSIITKASDSLIKMGPYGADNSVSNLNTVSTAIGQYANQFLMPSGSVEGEAKIIGGWGQERCRFMLTVDHETIGGGTTRSVVYGYTDVPGVSNLTGFKWSVDERMVFYINSIVDVGHQRLTQNGGAIDRYFAVDHKTVVSDQSTIGDNGQRRAIITPDTTLNKMAYNELTVADSNTGGMMITENTTDVVLPGKEKCVTRSDAVASNFVGKALVSYISTTQTEGYDYFQASNYANAAHKASLNIQSTENFIRAMKNASSGVSGVMFTLRDLMMFDPDCTNPQVMQVAEANMNVMSAGMSAYWHTSDLTTTLAYMVSQIVPSVMISNNITQLDFIASNETVDGLTAINISLIRTIFTIMTADAVLKVKISDHLNRELANALSAHNNTNYFLQVSCMLTGDCKVSLRIGSDPISEFVCPVYADNTFSINTTYNNGRIDQVASGIQYIITETNEAIQSNQAGANAQIFTGNFNSFAGIQPNQNNFTINQTGGF